ncbi:hypothetical protein FH972_026293 [Carpinus fangiana]|uniref:UDP-N-acetylglucosamine transferase subunit ALG14 n=1 Tax=Carpinus fangiana TaxID=176857 RepID=A0A5N6L3J5_9ROSI|nr:hypothetical protein FH972_026293 [Carpinus fangiana]
MSFLTSHPILFPAFLTLLFAVPIFFLRLIWLLPPRVLEDPPPQQPLRKLGTPTHLLIVLGSGGHTAEMLAMLRNLDTAHVTRRSYIVSSGDDFSARKAVDFEQTLEERAATQDGKSSNVGPAAYSIHVVPRARRIYQPLYTAPFTSAQCFAGCLRVLLAGRKQERPDLIVTNGPATAVIVVFAALVLKFAGLAGRGKMRTVYVESFARVKRLSLSGRILVWVVDRFLVQWETLRKQLGAKAEYRGVLV